MDTLGFMDAYASVLKSYVESREEQYLAMAADLGREILRAGVPPEEIAEIHEEAIQRFAGEFPDKTLLESVQRVSAPLMEMLMAYGLAFREQQHERKRAGDALRESEERFRSIVNNSPTKIHIKDLEGRYLLVNKEAEKLFGVTDEEARGKTTQEIFPEKQAADFTRHDRAVIQTEQTIVEEEEWLRDDGVHTFLTVKFPIRDGEGRITSVGAIGTDITERKVAEAEKARLETQLRHAHAQKMEALGTLAGGIAHDLNNTLVPVLGLAELTLAELPQESLAHKNLEIILAAAERAKKLVLRVLAFARQEKIVRKPVRLHACIEDAFEMLRAMLPSTIEIRKRLDERLAPILADESQIQQLLMNLASNASDALGSKAGIIEISLEQVEVDAKLNPVHTDLQPGPHAKLRFRDTGDGMDSETLERVLDPFFTTKPVGEGTGLGLSVVGGIIASHGGAITVSSEVGCGSTFDMYFPLMPTGAHETLQS